VICAAPWTGPVLTAALPCGITRRTDDHTNKIQPPLASANGGFSCPRKRREVKTMSGPVNIDSRGYGKIYKAIMRNQALPLLAKTIYAYFCAYAGNGTKAFPKRDKIRWVLQVA